ncbi:hypothetical protein SAMN02745136_02223 [Anaerocolumna jejuensis DSM 15929]|uniref:Uncharacterized protein n=1 Tax=Anaerocolumna jejuensis DSM 15929 TaxID=1121322 RepID=A0A1M6RC17_9FIRM|nr:hypothetical protein SAMN02745136_02223 [Anaerocolumna jejuensis DSM 15929]
MIIVWMFYEQFVNIWTCLFLGIFRIYQGYNQGTYRYYSRSETFIRERKLLVASVFRKLISREFGENIYYKYFYVCQRSLQEKFFDSDEIYQDIYRRVERRDKGDIKNMQTRLNESLVIAVRIIKTYIIFVVYVLAAVLYLVTLGLHPIVTAAGIILISLILLQKTYEYIINKYCYIDAQIVLIYKNVLDKLLLPEKKETR